MQVPAIISSHKKRFKREMAFTNYVIACDDGIASRWCLLPSSDANVKNVVFPNYLTISRFSNEVSADCHRELNLATSSVNHLSTFSMNPITY